MARRRYAWTEKRIAKFLREGRGLGIGASYTPWLTVSDIPSLGKCHRLFWPVTGREHHLLSDLEYYAFLRKCFDDRTLDIREQFPLPRHETLEIATKLGVKHPKINGVYIVMTTDLLVTRSTSSGPIERAYAVKPDDELLDRRTMEKLDIERTYWEKKGVTWAIIPGSSLRGNVSFNLEWIFDCLRDQMTEPPDEPTVREHLVDAIEGLGDFPLRTVCSVVDGRLALAAGRTLSTARRMLSEKALLVDLSVSNLSNLPASRFSVVER
ncbi:hypothetical protein V1277_002822 [Bradyrhizobium sp. AZCC 1588]|uniref:TnsA endonuclease N-terminal domain-containing protein n=1 Tax=unclassified Bradyrhizobium TaxID=2631580 RepID=UPI002FF2A189